MNDGGAVSELVVERMGPVALLTLDRPHHNNAITDQLLRQLRDVLPELESDGVTRAVVVTGAGGVFSSGFDISPAPAAPADDPGDRRRRLRDHADLASDTFWRIWRSPLPFVAAVERMCLGGAVYFTAVCDYMLTSSDAEIGMVELRMGLVPPLFNIFPWLMSYRQAKEFLLTGDVIDGARAVEIGLATRAVPAGDVLPAALALAQRLARMPEGVVAQMKRSVNRRWEVAGVVTEVEAGLDAFVQDKLVMSEFQKAFRELVAQLGVRPAIAHLGIDLGLREPYHQ